MPQQTVVDPNKEVTQEIYKKNVELLEERRRADELLYGISEAVFAVDKALNITLFNNTLEKMLGVAKDDAIGKPAKTFVRLKTEKGKDISLESVCFAQGSGIVTMESIVLLGQFDRNYFVNLKTSIITQRDGEKECLVTMADVTREKALEKTKDDFISITSHELRTPMSIIKSYLWMLLNNKGGALTEKQNEYAQKAAKSTERMLNLINDMLNISRMEQGRVELTVEQIDIKEFVPDALADFEIKTKEKGLAFKVEVDDAVGFAFFDKKTLREVLTNLVGNSFKFTDAGGIYVKATKENADFVKISVADTGRGLSQDDATRLFHKFGRLDNSYQTVAESGGTGLGLYIVKLYTEAIGGKVGVYSEGSDKGSTFWITLPVNYTQKKKLELDLTKKVESIANVSQNQTITS